MRFYRVIHLDGHLPTIRVSRLILTIRCSTPLSNTGYPHPQGTIRLTHTCGVFYLHKLALTHESQDLPFNYSNTRSHDLIIPLDEDIRRLFQECKIGRGNAALLAESVTYTKPEEMKEKEIVIKASLTRDAFVHIFTTHRSFMHDVEHLRS